MGHYVLKVSLCYYHPQRPGIPPCKLYNDGSMPRMKDLRMLASQTLKALAITAALALSACVTSHVIVGKGRPPISPDLVQLKGLAIYVPPTS